MIFAGEHVGRQNQQESTRKAAFQGKCAWQWDHPCRNKRTVLLQLYLLSVIDSIWLSNLMKSIRNHQFFKIKSQIVRPSESNIIFVIVMQNLSEPNIFFEEKHSSTHHDQQVKEDQCPESIPYLKKGDSNLYLEQFLAQPEEEIKQEEVKEEEPKEDNFSGSGDESFELSESGKFNPSAFHNFQKHLTVCLKHSIEISSEEKALKDYHIAAAKMWKIFKNSSVSTKKILHYLLGEKNEHKITDDGLKQYGLLKIQQAHGDRVVKEARNYLAKETLRQIREGKLEEYILAKKLKDKEKFKKYVQIFVEELEKGYLRKRLPKDKVAYLLRA